MKVRITLEAEFVVELNGEDAGEAEDRIASLIEGAANMGVLTGDGPAEIVTYSKRTESFPVN